MSEAKNKAVIAKKVEEKYIAKVDPVELAVRLVECRGRMKRPSGSTARQALDAMDKEDQAIWLGLANMALRYVSECMLEMNRVN